MANSLVALGSASVLAIYTSGYLRTRAAAERLAEDETPRRLAPPVAIQAPAAVTTLPPLAETAPPPALPIGAPSPSADLSEGRQVRRPQGIVAEPALPPPAAEALKTETAASPAASVVSTPAISATVPQVAAKVAVPAAPGASSSPAGPLPAPASSDPPSSAPAPAEAVAPGSAPAAPPQTPAPAVTPAAARYKDGTYTGWGTCRHGDIQATVVISSGRILSASISQCWTRYPCSWIAALPPQVAQRQSPEVDYVSGATQSTNAFYYAVVDALAKAK
jgi:uncharacterized protein with FMN-binding domain